MCEKFFVLPLAILMFVMCTACGADDDKTISSVSSAMSKSAASSVSSATNVSSAPAVSSASGASSVSAASAAASQNSDGAASEGSVDLTAIDMEAVQGRFTSDILNNTSTWIGQSISEASIELMSWEFTALSDTESQSGLATTGFRFTFNSGTQTITANRTVAVRYSDLCGNARWNTPPDGATKLGFWFKGQSDACLQFDFAGAGSTANYISMNAIESASGTYEPAFATSSWNDAGFTTGGAWKKVELDITGSVVNASALPTYALGFRTRLTPTLSQITMDWMVDSFEFIIP